MVEKNNKICIVCGAGYHYCPSCKKDGNKPSWYNIFDGENCKSIYDVCIAYRDGIYDLKKANEEINKCDLSNLENIEESFKKIINTIKSYKEVKVEEPKKVEKKNEIGEKPVLKK